MLRLLLTIAIFSCLVSQIVRGQLTIEPINTLNKLDQSTLYFKRDKDLHSGVLPLIRVKDSLSTNYLGGWKINKNTFHSQLQPLTLLSTGLGSQNQNIDFNYDLGVGIDYNLSTQRFVLNLKVLPYVSQANYFRDSIQQNLSMDPGMSRDFGQSVFVNTQFLLAYQLNSFFTFSGGYGKNLFGEGYRSLLLSDNSIAYPYFKIETDFGGIKYVNLYTMWSENTGTTTTPSLDRKKFTAQHLLSWNITKSFNLSVFETVIWQNKDTLVNRGFDLNYLNPVVFYRPVEYGIGSADNVLIGLSGSYKPNDFSNFYGQLVIDEFLLSELRAQTKWWGNKYGVQIGYKNRSFLLDDLYFQTEFNMVRPFTYSHKYPEISYGHVSSPAAHPIGANFYEILQRNSYVYQKLRLTNTITYAGYGVDSSSVNFGQNIFHSYANRDGNYEHSIMQGEKRNVFTETLNIQRQLGTRLNLYLSLTYRWRYVNQSVQDFHEHSLMIGIVSRFGNQYTDY